MRQSYPHAAPIHFICASSGQMDIMELSAAGLDRFYGTAFSVHGFSSVRRVCQMRSFNVPSNSIQVSKSIFYTKTVRRISVYAIVLKAWFCSMDQIT
jgi:hypothetical protein